MKPSEAPGWRALFGDAADLRALKRAYAGLARRWSPEAEAEEFQALRALYEAAVRELEAEARAAEARATEGEAGAAEGDGAEAREALEAAWVDARLAEIETSGLAAVCGALEERVRANRSTPAFFAAVCLAEAAAPERVAELLAEVPEAVLPATPGLAQSLLARRPALVDAPAWRRYTERFADPGSRHALLRAELEALRALERPDAAWALWEEREPETRRAGREPWRALAVRALRMEGPTRTEAVLDRWLERFASAELDLPDDVVEGLSRATCDAIAFGRARADAAVPPELLARLEELFLGAVWDRLRMLQTLAEDPAFRPRVEALAGPHPGVYSALLRVLADATGRERALRAWQDAKAPPPAPEVNRAPIEGPEAEDAARVKAAIDAQWRAHHRRHAAHALPFVGGLFGMYLGFRAYVGIHPAVGTLTVMIAAVIARWNYNRLQDLKPPNPQDRRGLPPPVASRDAVIAACRAQGVWIHEFAVADATDRRLDAALDLLLEDPLSDLAVIGPRHVRRALAEGASG